MEMNALERRRAVAHGTPARLSVQHKCEDRKSRFFFFTSIAKTGL